MKTLKFRWTGIRPLLMLNPRVVQASSPYAVKARELNEKMKKARKDNKGDILMQLEQEMAKNDWEGSAYWDQERKSFYLPDGNVLACLKKGMGKFAKDVDRAVSVDDAALGPNGIDSRVFIEIGDDFDTAEEAYEYSIQLNGKTVHPYKMVEQYYFPYRISGPVRIPPRTGPVVWKTRCMIPTGWKITFTLLYDEEVLSDGSLITGGFNAGRVVALGSWRPKFGRFTQEIWHNEAWDSLYLGADPVPKTKSRSRAKKKDAEPTPAPAA